MDKNTVTKSVIDVLKKIQIISGRGEAPITEDTCPIGGLENFDSLNGVEATIELSDEFDVDLSVINGFVDAKSSKPLTVSEVAEHICQIKNGKDS